MPVAGEVGVEVRGTRAKVREIPHWIGGSDAVR